MATKDLTVRILGDASNFNKALAGIGNSASVTGAKLTRNLTPAAAAVGVAMGKIGSAWNDSRDAIIVGTGATGDALDALIASSKRVAGKVPNDFGQVGQAIADVNTRLGLTGPELETVSKKALDLSRITKTDLSANIRASSRVVRDWGRDASEAGDVMDIMFRASQNTGIGFDRLGDKVVQFGAPLRQLGFTMEESIGLLAGFEQQGVNTETVMAGLRQGLSRIARAGEEPVEVFRRVTEEIKNAGSAGEANRLSLELFGARAGPDMAAAIREGRFEIDELVASLEGSGGSIDAAADATLRFTDRLAMLRNRIVGVLGPFGEFGGVIGGAVAALGPLLFGLGQLAPQLVKLRRFAAGAGLAMGAAGLAMVGYALHTAKAAEQSRKAADAIDELSRASDSEMVRSFGKALAEGALAADGFESSLANIARTSPGTLQRMIDMEDASGALTAQFVAQGLSTKEAADWVDKIGAALASEKSALDNAEKSAAALTDTTEDLGEAVDDVEDSVISTTRALTAHERAIARVTDRYGRMRDELSNRSAYLRAQDGLAGLARQAVETADVTEQQIIDMKRDLLDYGDTLDSQAAKSRVAKLVTDLDQDSFWATAIALEQLEKDRTVTFNVQTRGAARVNAVGSARAVHDGGMVVGGGIQSFAGLKDDEVPAVLQKGEAVLTPGQQAAMLGGGGGNTIINNYPAGWRDADDIANGRRRYDRIQGPM